jgi:UDP-N-acetylglucosamine/UDP-N-acetylgalactosamine diphosphorylase
MSEIPADVRQKLHAHGQIHLLHGWEQLPHSVRSEFLNELRRLDFALLKREHAKAGQKAKIPPLESIDVMPKPDAQQNASQVRRLGEQALSRGEVAVILVAGGRGSRLGFDKPKGMFPIGPVSGKSLFQIHAEKILARTRKHGGRIPLLIMTSDATHDETVDYFRENRHFGLPAEDVILFQQGTMPVLARDRFELLLSSPGKLCRSPNGHGGTLPALHDHGLLTEMSRRGIKHLFYFQVDNPLVKIADPLFLGKHIQARSEASSKVVPKDKPTDKIGNLVMVNGKCTIIEYHEPDETEVWARKGDRYLFLDGSPAIHIFDAAFFRRLIAQQFEFPIHLAAKKVSHLDGEGRVVEPSGNNAIQLETFIFDVLPVAERTLAVETTHAEEFAPLKNAESDQTDNPITVKRAISNHAASWLERAGVSLPEKDRHPVEISPLRALDPEDLREKPLGQTTIRGPHYLE